MMGKEPFTGWRQEGSRSKEKPFPLAPTSIIAAAAYFKHA